MLTSVNVPSPLFRYSVFGFARIIERATGIRQALFGPRHVFIERELDVVAHEQI